MPRAVHRRTGRSRSRRRPAAVLLGVLVGVLLTGCTTVVSGSGSPASPIPPLGSSGSGTTPPPSGSSAPPTGVPASCPVTDPRAGLQFDCLSEGMKNYPGPAYTSQVLLQTQSDPDWYASEDAKLVGNGGTRGLAASLGVNLTDFVSGAYPKGSTGRTYKSGDTTVQGQKAHIVYGVVTINHTGTGKGVLAKTDHLVAVIIQRDGTSASMLIISVPDTNPQLWPKMDDIIRDLELV